MPLKPPLEGEGNPADIVEVRGDLIVTAISGGSEDARDRVDWWLENGEDECVASLSQHPTFFGLTRNVPQCLRYWHRLRAAT